LLLLSLLSIPSNPGAATIANIAIKIFSLLLQ
jgi:hypothetical protein